MPKTEENPDSSSLILKTYWRWTPESMEVRAYEVIADIPSFAKQNLQRLAFDELTPKSVTWKAGQALCNQLAAELPAPKSFRIGDQEVRGNITNVIAMHSKLTEDGPFVVIAYQVSWTDGTTSEESHKIRSADFSAFVRDEVEQLHGRTNPLVYERVWEKYGEGKVDTKRWKQEKTGVFISYRSTAREAADQIFHGLGEYEDSSVFLPRIDHIDLQAGLWMDQLMEMINQCEVFIPILSNDYLEGPIAKPELDQALREHFHDTDKRIIPVLVEGKPPDYRDHFLGGFDMVQAQDGITSETIQQVAYRALGLSRNQYE